MLFLGLFILIFAVALFFYINKKSKDFSFDLVKANNELDVSVQLTENEITYINGSEVFKIAKSKLQSSDLCPRVKLTYALSCFLEFLVKEQKHGGFVTKQQITLAKNLTQLISYYSAKVDECELTIFDNNVLSRTKNIIREFDRCFKFA